MRGKLVRWTLDDGTVLSTRDAVLDVRPGDSQDYDTLLNVADHWGQGCELVQKFAEDTPASFLVRFDDGIELYAFLGDVIFD